MDFDAIIKKGSFALYTESDFLKREHNQFDTAIRTVITEITDLESVKNKIGKLFGNVEYEVFDGYIVIEPIEWLQKTRFNFSDLVEIVYRLRDPDGCPWDRALNNKSIRENIIEEAYELVEAVDLDSAEKMREEAGDVLLQSVLTAAIASKDDRFDIDDVVTELCVKLINRHTHIFGSDKALTPEEALKFWDKAKAKEKHQSSLKDKIDSIPVTFGALMLASKVQKYIKKTGFDFPDMQSAMEKLFEEIEEFKTADAEHKESEAGDILFAVVNVLRMSHIDPEVALNGTTNRFKNRFYYVVEQAEKQGKKVEELSLDEMEKYYQESKKFE